MPRKYFPNSRKHFPNSSRLLISISVITLHLVGPCKEKEKQEGKMVFAFWRGFTNSWRQKGERESYIQLNAEFQRIVRRDKKAFFNEWCIKIEEHNRREKMRNLFRKTGNIKGIFLPKDGHNKGQKWYRPSRCWRDQEEMKGIHGRTVQKKILMNWITTMAWSVTHSQTFWSVTLRGSWEALLSMKLMDVMEFQ